MCKNPLLRIISYRTIVNRKEANKFDILLNHLDDTAKVTWWYFNDACNDFMVSDLMIQKLTKYNQISKTEKDTLIDRILKHHTYLPNAVDIMKEIEPREEYYSIIRKQAELQTDNCHDLSLLFAVAKFKKQKDINFLKSKMADFTDNHYCNHNIFKAIEAFPDTAFYSILESYIAMKLKLEKQSSSDDLKYYCRAIAKYKSKRSLKLFEKILNKSNYPDTWYFKYNEEHVFEAIHKYRGPIYEKLYRKLKPKMSSYILEYLGKPDYDDFVYWKRDTAANKGYKY